MESDNTTHIRYESIHDIEVELCKAVGEKIHTNRSGSSMERFRKQLLNLVLDNLTDEEYDGLSMEAQLWVAKAADYQAVGRLLPKFDEAKAITTTVTSNVDNVVSIERNIKPPMEGKVISDEAKAQETSDVSGSVPPKKVRKQKALQSKEKSKPRARRASNDRSKKPAGYRLKEMLLEQGFSCHIDLILIMLHREGYRMSKSTMICVLSEFRQTLKLLEKRGLLNSEKMVKEIKNSLVADSMEKI